MGKHETTRHETEDRRHGKDGTETGRGNGDGNQNLKASDQYASRATQAGTDGANAKRRSADGRKEPRNGDGSAGVRRPLGFRRNPRNWLRVIRAERRRDYTTRKDQGKENREKVAKRNGGMPTRRARFGGRRYLNDWFRMRGKVNSEGFGSGPRLGRWRLLYDWSSVSWSLS